MKKRGTLIAAVTTCAFLLTPAAFAADPAETSPSTGSSATTPKASDTTTSQERDTMGTSKQSAMAANTFRASEVMGYTVKNPEGQELGEIEDLVIDKDGRIAYAVLSFGGFLGMGDKLFAIPWKTMKPMTGEQSFSLDVSKEKLENAPGFDKSDWPDMSDREWGSSVYRYYDEDPYWD